MCTAWQVICVTLSACSCTAHQYQYLWREAVISLVQLHLYELIWFGFLLVCLWLRLPYQMLFDKLPGDPYLENWMHMQELGLDMSHLYARMEGTVYMEQCWFVHTDGCDSLFCRTISKMRANLKPSFSSKLQVNRVAGQADFLCAAPLSYKYMNIFFD